MAENVHRLARGQGGHITREQLLRCGLPARTIDRWIATGRLICVYRGVYAVGHIPANPLDRAHAALLAAGPRCALAGACAMVLWEQWRRWPPRLEIVVAGDRRPRGLTVHHSSTLLARDVTLVGGLRVTSAARTLLDMAPRLSAKQLTRAVNDLRLRGALELSQLSDVLTRNRNHPSVTLLRPQLEIAQREPTRSELEDAFMRLVRRYGLPVPQLNVRVAGYRVDGFYPQHRLVVELDGWATHKTRHAFLRDRRQDAEILAASGIPTVRLPYEDTAHDGEATAARLAALLRSRAIPAASAGAHAVQI